MERFDVHLRVDYTVTDDVIRSDYSLLYDEDSQLLCDDGMMELRKIPGYSDWCRYTGTKSLKFAADFLNVLAPGVLFMEVQRAGVGIEGLARYLMNGATVGGARRTSYTRIRRPGGRAARR
jgi:hypothetical protein